MRLAAVMLLAISFLAFAGTFVEIEDISVTLVNQNPDPVEPGDNVEIRFRLENDGAMSDKLQVELLPKYPFSTEESAVKGIGSLDARQSGNKAVVVKYNVQVDSTADEGAYEIYLRYRIGNNGWIQEGPFDISVKPAEAILSVVSADYESISAGDASTLNINLKNFGKSLIKDVRVNLDLSAVPISPIGSSSEKVISMMPAGASETASFNIITDASAVSGNYNMDVKLTYLDDSGNSYTRNSTIGLVIYNAPEFNVAVRDSKVVTPDSTGEVVLSVSNVGPSEIKFMTIKLLPSDYYKVVSATEVYLGNLEADDFETAEFDLNVPKGQPGDIELTVLLTYKDSLNRDLQRTEKVLMPLYSKPDAVKFGLTAASGSALAMFVSFGVQIIVLVFIIFMLIDCWKNNIAKYRKVLWSAIILTGIGAVLYYFIARRKR